jgi:hypothetical protein
LSFGCQDRGKAEEKSPLGMGGMFKNDIVVGNSLFASLVEEAKQLWTKIWGDGALYEKAIALNVQVLLGHESIHS